MHTYTSSIRPTTQDTRQNVTRMIEVLYFPTKGGGPYGPRAHARASCNWQAICNPLQAVCNPLHRRRSPARAPISGKPLPVGVPPLLKLWTPMLGLCVRWRELQTTCRVSQLQEARGWGPYGPSPPFACTVAARVLSEENHKTQEERLGAGGPSIRTSLVLTTKSYVLPVTSFQCLLSPS